MPPVPNTAPTAPQPSGVALRVHDVHWLESLPGAGWRRSGRLAPVTEEARPRPWRLPPSGGPRVRPERPGGAAIVFARRSDGRRALRSRSCVPSVELTVVYRCCSRLCRLLQLMNPTVASFRPGPSATGASAPHAATGGTCADAAVPGREPGHCGIAPGGPWPATAPTPAHGRTARGRSGGHPTGDAGGAARRSRPQPRRTGAWDCFAAGGSDPADRACPPARTAAASCAGSGARCRTGPRPHRSETRRALRGQPGSGTRPTAVHPRLRRKHPCRTGSWGIADVQPNVSTMSRAQTVKHLLRPHTDSLLPQVRAALASSAERVGFAQDDWSSPARSSAAMPTHDRRSRCQARKLGSDPGSIATSDFRGGGDLKYRNRSM